MKIITKKQIKMDEEKTLKDKEQEFYFLIPNKEETEMTIKCYKSKDVEEAVNDAILCYTDSKEAREYILEKYKIDIYKSNYKEILLVIFGDFKED